MTKNKYLIISLIVISLVSLIALPVGTKAKTITEFESEVAKYTKELESIKSKIATNDAEIAKIKANISSIEKQIKTAEAEIETLQAEIDKSNEEIKEKSDESKKIIEYYQISNGTNAYLEYAFGAESITDMIYRMSVVEQLTEYNDRIMKELEELIEKNQKQQKDLADKNEELEKNKKELMNQKLRLDADSASLKAGMPGIEQQIKTAKNQLQFYKSLGCGANEDIQACQFRIEQSTNSSIPSTNGFFRPIENGYVTQWYSGCKYFDPYSRTCTGHIGIDISSNNKSIDVYPIAPGVVTGRYYDNAGALVVKIKHNYNGKYIYSTYAHQRNFAVKEGQYVSVETTIGQMGSTGYSTGPHVHLEITSCDWYSKGGGCSWQYYAESSSFNPANYVNFPSKWNNR